MAFRHFNERVTKCYLQAGDIDIEAVAKCNVDEGDKFDEKFGEELSLAKANTKLGGVLLHNVSEVKEESRKMFFDIEKGLSGRLARRWRKVSKLKK